MKNPLASHQPTLGEKVSSALHKIPGRSHQPTRQEKIIHALQRAMLYLAIFIAGYMIGTVQHAISISL